MLAVDMHPAHALVQGAQVEPARQHARRGRDRHDLAARRADALEGGADRRVVDLEVAKVKRFALLLVGSQHHRRAAAPHADFEQVAPHPLGFLEIEQAAPQGV